MLKTILSFVISVVQDILLAIPVASSESARMVVAYKGTDRSGGLSPMAHQKSKKNIFWYTLDLDQPYTRATVEETAMSLEPRRILPVFRGDTGF